MRNDESSKTAQATALYRAIESLRPEKERVCYDPMARDFLSGPVKLAAGSRFLSRKILESFDKKGLGSAYGFPVARTPVIDGFLMKTVDDGATQVVIVGAGYDSRAYRLRSLANKTKVFEIDDPNTQSVKTAKVRKAIGCLPVHVSYIPLKLGRDDLGESLLKNGYRADAKTVFICEGILMYMKPEAVDDLFLFMKNESSAGSGVVFDYPYNSAVKGTSENEEAQIWLDFLNNLGEPPLFGIQEGKLDTFLHNRGFNLKENLSGTELEQRCFKERGRDQRVPSFLSIATAGKLP